MEKVSVVAATVLTPGAGPKIAVLMQNAGIVSE
jgi:hypothetical protein